MIFISDFMIHFISYFEYTNINKTKGGIPHDEKTLS